MSYTMLTNQPVLDTSDSGENSFDIMTCIVGVTKSLLKSWMEYTVVTVNCHERSVEIYVLESVPKRVGRTPGVCVCNRSTPSQQPTIKPQCQPFPSPPGLTALK
ncbi:hypothetical protein GOODEAATRI_030507 [Goodea atripinnis]|uniref:Uncharacterized protein n=1 Tax=Goodea atripinnis TaxID=208336 RepID=A0ABV0NZ88_9TELE